MKNLITAFLPLIGLLLLAGIGAAIIAALKQRLRRKQPTPYEKEDALLTPAEQSFFHVLEDAVGAQFRLFAKVRLADVFFVARPNVNLAFVNRVAQRHVDFLICDTSSLRPIAAVELDDSSHARPDRQKSDSFLNEVFSSASLPLVRITARASYTAEEISRVLSYVVPSASSPTSATAPDTTSPPTCPKCGIPMVVRQVSQGQHKGKRFYGCLNFPQCRQVIAIDR